METVVIRFMIDDPSHRIVSNTYINTVQKYKGKLFLCIGQLKWRDQSLRATTSLIHTCCLD